MGRHRIYGCLLLFLTVFLTACGEKESNRGMDGFVYVAEELLTPEGGNLIIRGEYLYYWANRTINCLPIEEVIEGEKLSSGKVVFDGGNGEMLCGYTLDDKEGGYYALMKTTLNTKTWKDEITSSALVKQQADGTEIYRLDLDKRDIANVSLAVDGDGRAFLLTKAGLYVVDAEGNFMAEIPGNKLGVEFEAGSGRLLEGEDGSVYYSPTNYCNVIYEVSGDDAAFREGTFQMKRIELPSPGRCYSAPEGILFSSRDGILYQYRQDGAKWDVLLRFSDSSLVKQPQQMLWLSEESLLALYNNYPDQELFLLTKTDTSQLLEEEELVLAVLTLPTDLERYLAEFSRSSGCHVTVEYYQGENWAARLDAAMVSPDPPDLIVLEDETAVKFGRKGILEDLSPYLEKSGVLGRGIFLDNVLDGYTIDGRLVGIPDSFFAYATFGRSSQLGTEAGWTAAEAMAFADAHPKAQLFKNPTFTSMMAFFQEYILESFIDWERGECSFEGEEFQALVRWMEEHSDGFGSGYASYSGDSMDFLGEVIPENQLLSLDCTMYFFRFLFDCEQYFGESITPVGYPTPDGRPFYTVHAYNAVGIAAGSHNKERAWQFIEGFLAQEKEESGSFPSRRDLLEKMMEEEMTVEYEQDENGEILYHQEGEHAGEPVKNRKMVITVGGELIPYYYMTQEQADKVMGIIEAADFTPRMGGLKYDIMGILLEELGPYIEGKRSLEETTRILQNRVRNLVQENL